MTAGPPSRKMAGGGESPYSCAGICCSISRQALILRRRQTQQSGSLDTVEVSAPQTEQTGGFLSRSGEKARFACSRISGDTTTSGLICGFRFISPPALFSLWQNAFPGNNLNFSLPPLIIVGSVPFRDLTFDQYQLACTERPSYPKLRPLCRFRNLDHHRNIQGRPATRAPLSGHDPRELSLHHDDVGRHVMGADRAVSLARGSILNQCFHFRLPSLHRTLLYLHGLYQNRKDS